MSLLQQYEVEEIIKTYLELKSINKTCEKLGYARNTVNKYVKKWSSKDKRSRDNNTPVLKIDVKTGSILERYKNANQAAVKNSFNSGGLNQCLNGKIKTYKGFVWRYKKD